jgi:hypothetical protein
MILFKCKIGAVLKDDKKTDSNILNKDQETGLFNSLDQDPVVFLGPSSVDNTLK